MYGGERQQGVPASVCRGGAAVRYRTIHRDEVEDIVALDIALKCNDQNWFEHLPEDISAPILHKLYYDHFSAMSLTKTISCARVTIHSG
jgi:D-lactate dehydrogenase